MYVRLDLPNYRRTSPIGTRSLSQVWDLESGLCTPATCQFLNNRGAGLMRNSLHGTTLLPVLSVQYFLFSSVFFWFVTFCFCFSIVNGQRRHFKIKIWVCHFDYGKFGFLP